jgi:site-specific DNA recombinase
MTEPSEESPTGEFISDILVSFGALEKAIIRERSMLGSARIAREGKWMGGKPPFGYRIGGDRSLEIEPEEAALVRRIFISCPTPGAAVSGDRGGPGGDRSSP